MTPAAAICFALVEAVSKKLGLLMQRSEFCGTPRCIEIGISAMAALLGRYTTTPNHCQDVFEQWVQCNGLTCNALVRRHHHSFVRTCAVAFGLAIWLCTGARCALQWLHGSICCQSLNAHSYGAGCTADSLPCCNLYLVAAASLVVCSAPPPHPTSSHTPPPFQA